MEKGPVDGAGEAYPRESAIWTAEEERKLVWKLDLHIIPIVFVLYMLAFLDRSNIGNAYTGGLGTDLQISSAQYQGLLTIFYISYVVFQCLILGWKVVAPRILASTLAMLWGIIAILQAACTNWSGLMAVRFFLGLVETSFAPGIALYLGFFYSRSEFALRFGIYASAAALGSCFAGALAYGLLSATHISIAPWRLLFIVEGAPTLIAAVAAYFLLPNSIQSCTFLSEREKHIARARMYGSNRYDGEWLDTRAWRSTVAWQQVWAACLDPVNIVFAIMFFIVNDTYASLPVYLSTILKESGFTALRAQGLSAPPFAAAWISAIASTFISDRIKNRGLLFAGFSLLTALGYLLLAIFRNEYARYGASFMVAIGGFTVVPLIYAWQSSANLHESRRGAAFSVMGLVGQVGPILGVRLYPASEAPFYTRGMIVQASLALVNVFLGVGLSIYFMSLNRKAVKEVQAEDDKSEDKVALYYP